MEIFFYFHKRLKKGVSKTHSLDHSADKSRWLDDSDASIQTPNWTAYQRQKVRLVCFASNHYYVQLQKDQ